MSTTFSDDSEEFIKNVRLEHLFEEFIKLFMA